MTGQIDAFQMVMALAGGLALFLFGMEQLSSGLKSVAGDRMKTVLAKLTANRFLGVLTGAFVTAVIQSSSVTTVLVVGFISAGLMTMSQSVGVIMGANIGTTVTAQVVAFKISQYALLMIAIGFAMVFIGKGERLRQSGVILMGLGLVFFGMGVMGDAMAPLRSYPPFLDAMVAMEHPMLGILVGAVFTALVQSSSATTAIVIVLASQGLITLAAGIALAFGSNIGTCVTALLASVGKPRDAVRAALVHVIFNIAGVLVWIAFIPVLADVVVWVSPQAEDLQGAARLAAETPRQIANAHTIFNVSNTLIFIWFTVPLAHLVQRLAPDKPGPEPRVIRPRYLNDDLIQTPSLALSSARLEVGRLGELVQVMLAAILPAFHSGSRQRLEAVARMDQDVDDLHRQVMDYLRRVGLEKLTEDESRELVDLMTIANSFEGMGDVIETDLVRVGTRAIEEHIAISESTAAMITEFHAAVKGAVDLTILAAGQRDQAAAERVLGLKSKIAKKADDAAHHCARRLVEQKADRFTAYTREMEMVEKLKRIYTFAKRIARAVEPHSELDSGRP